MKRLVLILLCGFSAAAYADSLPKDEVQAERYTYDYLFMIDALIRHKKYDRAQLELDALLERVRDNPQDTALAWQAYGYLHIGRNDFAAAIRDFKMALEAGTLPETVAQGLRYTLAQLLYTESRFAEGLSQLELWKQKTDSIPPQAEVLTARFHYALEAWQAAYDALQRAISKSPDPQEPWYQMWVGICFEQNWLKRSIPILREMLQRFPDKAAYWQQLANVHLQLGQVHQAVTVLHLAEAGDLLDEAGLLRLIRLQMQDHSPYNAARLLENLLEQGKLKQSSEHLKLLADAWLLAREPDQALSALQRQASIDSSGEAQLRAGRILFEQEQWKNAADMLESGLRLSDSDRFEDWLLLGNAHSRLQQWEEARSAVSAAIPLARDKAQRTLANDWVTYLESRSVKP
ncbi:MAG: tetratricopeptide repeat protein [Candidatus Thiodiazotropha sp.]